MLLTKKEIEEKIKEAVITKELGLALHDIIKTIRNTITPKIMYAIKYNNPAMLLNVVEESIEYSEEIVTWIVPLIGGNPFKVNVAKKIISDRFSIFPEVFFFCPQLRIILKEDENAESK